MEKYTFTQIVNERIRQLKELKKQAEALNELMIYNDKYKYRDNRVSFVYDDPSVVLHYQYANQLRQKIYMYKHTKLDHIFGSIDHHIIRIINADDVKSEYKSRFNSILTITDSDEFKARVKDILTSDLAKELSSYNNRKIITAEDGTQLVLYPSYFYFEKNENKFDFFTLPSIEGYDTIPNLLDDFKNSEFSSDCFSDLFRERLERDSKDDFSIELDPSCDYSQFARPDLKGCYKFGSVIKDGYHDALLEYEFNEPQKKIVLKKYEGD